MHRLCCPTANSRYLSCDGARHLILPFSSDPFSGRLSPGVPAPADSVQILYTSIISSDTGDGMADDDIQIESVAGELTSGIQKTSAMMMKAAYLPVSLKKQDGGFGIPFFKTASAHHDEEVPGPDARVYITKISDSIPADELDRILSPAPYLRNYDFYTLFFYLNIHLDEPSTTRFINAIVTFAFPPEIKILDFSPKEKERMIKIAETAGDGLFLSRSLVFSPSLPHHGEPDDPDRRFEVRVGPEEKISLTRSRQGYAFIIPKDELLEYEGMRKNEHEVFWEIYPRMPPEDSEYNGGGRHAIFSFIVRAPRSRQPEVTIYIEGKVKGKIWGVVPITGSVNFLQHGDMDSSFR